MKLLKEENEREKPDIKRMHSVFDPNWVQWTFEHWTKQPTFAKHYWIFIEIFIEREREKLSPPETNILRFDYYYYFLFLTDVHKGWAINQYISGGSGYPFSKHTEHYSVKWSPILWNDRGNSNTVWVGIEAIAYTSTFIAFIENGWNWSTWISYKW